MEDLGMWENRYERIQGEIVMMAPSPGYAHNSVIVNLVTIFRTYLKGKRCKVFTDGMDVRLDEENTFKPDVMIVCRRDIIKADAIYGAPDLVVEVLSPSTQKNDRTKKKDAYERHGVREYWLVNPMDKSIEVYHGQDGHFTLDDIYVVYPEWQWEQLSEKEKENTRLSLKVSLYDDLVIDIREIFED